MIHVTSRMIVGQLGDGELTQQDGEDDIYCLDRASSLAAL